MKKANLAKPKKKGKCDRCREYSDDLKECPECDELMCEACIPRDAYDDMPCITCEVEWEMAGTGEKDDYGC